MNPNVEISEEQIALASKSNKRTRKLAHEVLLHFLNSVIDMLDNDIEPTDENMNRIKEDFPVIIKRHLESWPEGEVVRALTKKFNKEILIQLADLLDRAEACEAQGEDARHVLVRAKEESIAMEQIMDERAVP